MNQTLKRILAVLATLAIIYISVSLFDDFVAARAFLDSYQNQESSDPAEPEVETDPAQADPETDPAQADPAQADPSPPIQPTPTTPKVLYEGDEPGECSDGADNDRDGDFDCKDSQCAGAPACTQAEPSALHEE